MVFVPHRGNQYRPHLIRRYGILVVLLLVIGVQVGYNVSTTGSVLGSKVTVTDSALLADTNSQRSVQNLPALNINPELSQAAYLKANDMFKQQYWAHVAPDGTTPWVWFSKVDYNYAYAGENLAKNFTTADAATAAWMASPEHKANILDTHYTDVGFAVVSGTLKGQNTLIIVALYGQPVSQKAVAGVSTSTLSAPTLNNMSIVTRLGLAVQALTPAALGSILLLIAVAGVAFTAHLYRNKLPKNLRQGWYRHHGLIKVAGMMSLVVTIITIYGGGQI